MQLFWTKGYEATSMADIVEATGLSKSSLYGAFGSKHELLDAALDRYLRDVFGRFLAQFAGGEGGLDDVHAFVDAYRDWLLGEAANRGCLAVNTANELGNGDDMVSRRATEYRQMFRRALREPLERAAGAGEIDPRQVDPAIEQLIAMSLAASVFSRSRAGAIELDRLVAAAHALVAGWRDQSTGS